jgi:hypothetical protein
MEIPKELHNEIWDYCRLNNITAIDDFTIKLIRQGFTVEKYGATPVTKEKIVEKIVEVPVEKIVEKIIEVPVQMVDEEKDTRLRDSIVQVQQLSTQIDSLKTELELEKQKNKKDIYGER